MGRKRRPPSGPQPRPHLPWDELHPTLDLHGETAEAARRRAERWLRDQQAEGVRVVRVITGRGRRSVGPPVLRGEIQDLLDGLRGTVVASVTSESAGGAFRVELRRPRHPTGRAVRPSPATRPPPGARDPELTRLALESLAELGVTPTPALLEAEIRRLLRERGEGEV